MIAGDLFAFEIERANMIMINVSIHAYWRYKFPVWKLPTAQTYHSADFVRNHSISISWSRNSQLWSKHFWSHVSS